MRKKPKQHKKLYVVVRDDLTPAQKAVQAGHALAEWVLKHKEKSDWNNGTLVYLETNHMKLKNMWIQLMYGQFHEYAMFCEPDMNNDLTAIASIGPHKLFKKLPLLK